MTNPEQDLITQTIAGLQEENRALRATLDYYESQQMFTRGHVLALMRKLEEWVENSSSGKFLLHVNLDSLIDATNYNEDEQTA